MSSKLCPFCMRMTEDETCPHCGKNVNYTGQPAHLPAGYVVSGKHPYVLGAALGQGGFGITYIALDMVTNERVAIKEYYPTHCSVRSNTSTVTAYSNQEEVYLKGKKRFLDEARTLKSLSDLKNIVNVLDFFEANNTAYLVMEFLDGTSLKEYVVENGKFPAQKFLSQIRPLMADIHRMHERGVIHRDIAPDNIILMPDGQMKLIDFGTARSYVGDKSMTVVVKKGFAPVEQYMSKGSTATTDVYALAATIYYCITGKVPPDSAARQYDNAPLDPPSAHGADMTAQQEKALLKALEIQQKDRTQSVQEFSDNLRMRKPVQQKTVQKKPVQQKTVQQKPVQTKPVQQNPVKQKPETQDSKTQGKKETLKPSGKKWIPVTAAVAVLAVLILVMAVLPNNHKNAIDPLISPVAQANDTIPVTEPSSTIPTNQSALWEDNVLMANPLSANPDIRNIQNVTFLDSCSDAPADAWDVSEAKNGSVLAWAKKYDYIYYDVYDVYIAGEGGINAMNACKGLFADCSMLETVHFGNAFHTDYATNMRDMFANCNRLTTLDVSGWDTSNVTSMYGMFHGCSSLSMLEVSGWNTSNVTTMSKMFYSCNNLSSLNISNWDISNVESYEHFMSSGKQINGRPWEEFFKSDRWQENVLMADPLSALHQISRENIQSVTFLDTCADAPGDALDVSGAKNGSVLAWADKDGNYYDIYIAGENGINAQSACEGLFSSCTSLRAVHFGNAFHTDYAANMNTMFANCHRLTNLDVGGWNTSNSTNMGGIFYGCSNLTTLDVSGWDTSSVTSMEKMFYDCINLHTPDVSKWDISNVGNMSMMFYKCNSLTGLDVSKWDTSNATSMESMFCYCHSMTTLDASGWDTSSVTDTSSMFYYCNNLSSLDISRWNTSSVTDMSSMFYYCNSLSSLDISRWNTSNVTDMHNMFYYCNNLSNLDISNWDVSNVKNYECFMPVKMLINGRSWVEIFKS